mgnify:CR=1 FL=1
MNLEDYGFIPTTNLTNDAVNEEIDSIPARITAVYKERYELICQQGKTFGRLKTSVYYGGGTESFPTAGDFVMINYNANGDSQITRTLQRKSYFSRRHPDLGRGEQAVAANFDYVFIMQSLNYDFNLKRLERYITLSWQSGAIPLKTNTSCRKNCSRSWYSCHQRSKWFWFGCISRISEAKKDDCVSRFIWCW